MTGVEEGTDSDLLERFTTGHDEAAFAKNRRAHFVITAK